jgi:hypothetical protein
MDSSSEEFGLRTHLTNKKRTDFDWSVVYPYRLIARREPT